MDIYPLLFIFYHFLKKMFSLCSKAIDVQPYKNTFKTMYNRKHIPLVAVTNNEGEKMLQTDRGTKDAKPIR